MTKILVDKAVLEQALEALDSDNPDIHLRAALVLKAALAQEEQAAVEIKPPNLEGATQCIVRWMVETPAGWVGAWDREALQQFVTPPSREPAQEEQEPCTYRCEAWPECVCVHLAKPAQEQEPWTDRELELIDGMIEVQLRHAAQCNVIANRPMAEKQRGWDMERVALLRKIRNAPPRREWKGLTEQRDELLEALKDAAEAFEILANGGSVDAHQAAQILRSDIAKAEGA